MAASSPSTPAAGARGPPPAFFVESKKGEVNELRTLLRTVLAEKDNKRKRDVIKKVIAYMTLGIDVSRLFSDMVLASNTKDIVVKKMVYLFLCNYAAANAELTLLAINTLQKDCRDEDPMIRGLALRSLCSLRLDSVLEYVMTPLQNSLSDPSGYVRKTGVLGVLKVFHLAPSRVKESDMIDTLYNLLRDRDAQVVANCISSLNEILAEEGGMAINQAIIHHLLNRIRDFNEWGQCLVLSLVARYTPANQEELFAIMNLLDVCLKIANTAVVSAATKCFLNLTAGLPDIRTQVFLRIRTPLLTLMASASPEVAFCVLSHVLVLAKRAPGVFDDEFKQFFCGFSEPTSVKHVKMDILPLVANDANMGEIVSELAEYVSDVDADMAKHAIRAIALIAIRLPSAANRVIECLLDFFDHDVDYVKSETLTVMKDVLRKYPARAPDVIPSLHRCLKSVEDQEGKAAVVWMIGEFGQLIDEGPYLLEHLIDTFEEESSITVKLELLTASVKLFFKRPPEMQKMLGRLFKKCMAEATSVSLHDRALLYFRILSKSPREAADIIGAKKPISGAFLEDRITAQQDQVFREFDTLSVVYSLPEVEFVDEQHRIKPLAGAGAPLSFTSAPTAAPGAPSSAPAPPAPAYSSGGGSLLDDPFDTFTAPRAPAPAPAPAPATAASRAGGDIDLLGLDFGFGGSAPAPAPAPPAAPTFSLVPSPQLDPSAFQSKWLALPAAATVQRPLTRPPVSAEIDGLIRSNSMSIIASGDVGAQLKIYFFGKDAAGAFYLVEALVNKSPAAAVLTIKSEGSPASVASFQQLLTGNILSRL